MSSELKSLAVQGAKEVGQMPMHSNDWVIMVFMGFGLTTFHPLEYLGGLVLAIGFAMLMWRMGRQNQQDKRKFWLVLGSAAGAAWLAAEIHTPLSAWILGMAFDPVPEVPVQVSMAIAGAGSKFIVGFLFSFFSTAEGKRDDLADRILGGDKK